MERKIFKTTVGGREMTVEIGAYCGQANGSCIVRCGDTVVMVNATMAKEPREGMDYFPLSVDYEEKMYAVGKIPGGFKKREGRASDKAILTARLIDRPIRPLFPKGMYNDVSVVATVLSVDTNIPPERHQPRQRAEGEVQVASLPLRHSRRHHDGGSGRGRRHRERDAGRHPLRS